MLPARPPNLSYVAWKNYESHEERGCHTADAHIKQRLRPYPVTSPRAIRSRHIRNGKQKCASKTRSYSNYPGRVYNICASVIGIA